MQLASMYSGFFPVALALRKATDDGDIDRAASRSLRRRRARSPLPTRWAVCALPAWRSPPPIFSLGFVARHLWTRYSHSDGKLEVEIHTGGPLAAEALVLTGEVASMELRAGRLTVDQSMAEGLVVIDAAESATAAIGDALMATSCGEAEVLIRAAGSRTEPC